MLRSIGRGGDRQRRIKLGSVIVREHQGTLHEVIVAPGGFAWRGKTYASLSTIAKLITGTSWNGPRFFGLRAKERVAQCADAGVEGTSASLASKGGRRPARSKRFELAVRDNSLAEGAR